jgi:hypothetical protein
MDLEGAGGVSEPLHFGGAGADKKSLRFKENSFKMETYFNCDGYNL